MRYLIIFCLLLSPFFVSAQLSASELIDLSIQYHDPSGNWGKKKLNWTFHEERPDGSMRVSEMEWTPKNDRFVLLQQLGENQLHREVNAEDCISKLNGNTSISEEDAKKYRLNCERNAMYRNYYTYLWGMPMKLKDPGTIIDPTVKAKDFFGQDLLEIQVTYDPEVGGDIWYFYFDPTTYALSGYRFYHDESANDGEYILFEGEVEKKGMKIPANRTWYTHKDQRLLGTDRLQE
ncbi:MAG: DUF6503 family protein [Bacteroidota bacterium]